MNNWLKELTGTDKAVIAMCHLQPLPGDPYYDKEKGMEYALEAARKDLHALQDGGVDAVMFSNEFSLPYLTDVEPVTVAAMANIIGELKHEIKIPFGVNVLWDAKNPLIWQLPPAQPLYGRFLPACMPAISDCGIPMWARRSGISVQWARRR